MTLREMMIAEIAGYGWLDYEFCRDFSRVAEYDKEAYIVWLRKLSDADLLMAYNRVRDATNKLD